MADPNPIPQDRIRIFSRDGAPLGEFRASVDRSSAIGEESRAEFTYAARISNVVSDTLLSFGNWILIENDTLPSWVGVIDPPAEWDSRAKATPAYTPEHIFGWRRGPMEKKLTGSAGSIFSQLIALVNHAEPTIITPGTIYQGSAQHEKTINPIQLDEALRDIYEESGEEYTWRPVVNAKGFLVVYADWFAQLGTDTGILLQEGSDGGNIEAVSNMLVEDVGIYNEILAYGDGATWLSKPTANAQDAESIGKYGLRQIAVNFSGVTSVQTLQDHAETYLKLHKEPIRTYSLNALNVGDTLKYVRLGNIFTLRFQNIRQGLDKTVRITGINYEPDKRNKIDITAEEVIQ